MQKTDFPPWVKSFLSPEDALRISAAVQKAETNTCGEIVPMIVRRSSVIGHIPLMLGLLFSTLFLCFMLLCLMLEMSYAGHWRWTLWGLPLGLLFVVLVAPYVSRAKFVQRIFIPEEDRDFQVQIRAQHEFYATRTHHTQARTGILIFLSLMERKAIVLADQGISSKLPESTWKEIIEMILKGIKNDKTADGLIQAIEECGKILSRHFPIHAQDKNELINQLIVKE